ncbi:MAG: hydrolase YhcX [Melioribacteraceae bacterium]|nr:MAG: hydrolase YhcX [Melioribacteraceae bacterium]
MSDKTGILLKESTIEDFAFVSQSAKELTNIAGFYKRTAFENRVIFFNEGQISVGENNRVYLFASSIRISSDYYKNSFRFLRGPESGYISDHNPDGDTLFIFNLVRDEKNINYSAFVNLLEYYKKYARKNNLRKVLLSLQSYYYPELFLEDNLNDLIRDVETGEKEHPLFTRLNDAGFTFSRIVEHRGEKESFSDLILQWNNYDFKEKLFYAQKKNSAGICSVQMNFKSAENFKEYASRVKYFVELASSYKRDFIVFPEYSTLTLLPDQIESKDIPLFISKYTEEFSALFKQMAHKHNINIVAGSTITLEEEKFYNTFFLFNRNGDIHKQNKIHLLKFEKTDLGLSPGNKVEVFPTDICDVGIVSGYDAQFPEPVRKISNEGARILFVPLFANDEKEFYKVKQTTLARCIENQIFAVLSGSTGKINALNTDFLAGRSMVMTPHDFVFSQNGISSESEKSNEDVVLDEINLELLRRNRRFGDSSNWIDRRLDLYNISWKKD